MKKMLYCINGHIRSQIHEKKGVNYIFKHVSIRLEENIIMHLAIRKFQVSDVLKNYSCVWR